MLPSGHQRWPAPRWSPLLASDASGLASTSCPHPYLSLVTKQPALPTTGWAPCAWGASPAHSKSRGQRQPWGLLCPHMWLLSVHPECPQVSTWGAGLGRQWAGHCPMPHWGHTAHCSGGLPCPSGSLPQSAPHDRRVLAAHRGALQQHGALGTGWGMPWAPKDISHLRPLIQDWEE